MHNIEYTILNTVCVDIIVQVSGDRVNPNGSQVDSDRVLNTLEESRLVNGDQFI